MRPCTFPFLLRRNSPQRLCGAYPDNARPRSAAVEEGTGTVGFRTPRVAGPHARLDRAHSPRDCRAAGGNPSRAGDDRAFLQAPAAFGRPKAGKSALIGTEEGLG